VKHNQYTSVASQIAVLTSELAELLGRVGALERQSPPPLHPGEESSLPPPEVQIGKRWKKDDPLYHELMTATQVAAVYQIHPKTLKGQVKRRTARVFPVQMTPQWRWRRREVAHDVKYASFEQEERRLHERMKYARKDAGR
jgi:hypothetical protein